MTKEEWIKDKASRLAVLAIEQALLSAKLNASSNIAETIHLHLNIILLEAKKMQVIAQPYPRDFPSGAILCNPCVTNETEYSKNQTFKIINELNNENEKKTP